MTQTGPGRLIKMRAVSCDPETGWVSYPRMNAVCRARGQARTTGTPTDISSFPAGRRLEERRRQIESSRTRHASEVRVRASCCRNRAGWAGTPDTEFISVRLRSGSAPMNRSLDWGCRKAAGLGSVGSPI